MLDKVSVAVIGATGAVGQRFIQMLNEHPWFSADVLAASDKTAGKKYGEIVKWNLSTKMPDYVFEEEIHNIEPEIFKNKGIELIFSALPADIARDIEPKMAAAGFKVFSNASAYRMAENVPLLIADVNPVHLDLVVEQQKVTPGFLVTNPNCCVTGLATVLQPINEQFGIKSVIVSTYQALSGAGYPGVPSMDIIGNVIPYIADEEDKMENECQKILGSFSNTEITPSNFEVIANCTRVPVRDGHLEAVTVELTQDASLDEFKESLSSFDGLNNRTLPTAPQNAIILTNDENRPQPMFDLQNGSPLRAKGMAVTTGRFKKFGNKIRFFLLVHNTIRGAAGCSIMNAELAKHEGFI